MLRTTLLACACFVALFVSSAHALGDEHEETIKNFKKYFSTYKDTPSRVEAILSLGGIDEPVIVDLIVPILKDTDLQVVSATIKVLSGLKAKPAIEELYAQLKNDKTEQVRTGVLRAIADGKYDGASAAAQLYLGEKSWEVRRRALQVIGAVADAGAAAAIVPLCDDKEVAIRCQAIETLTALNSDLVVPKACAALNDLVWQVRASAIKALGQIRSLDAIDPLVNRLAYEDGRLVPEIIEALSNLTGQEFVEMTAWKNWWAGAKTGFVLPTPEAIKYLRTKHVNQTGKPPWNYPKTGVAEYHTINTASKSIMFVIDVSGSMESEVTEKERFSDGNYPSYERIDIVKTELSRTIDRLADNVNFNIIAFATKVNPWKKKLVPANILNKSAAKDFVKTLIAIGGNSKEDLATNGLTGSADLSMGKTNTYGALMTAMGIDPKALKEPRTGGGTGDHDKDYKTDIDTVFFLSDGRPTVGEFVDPDDILRELKAANELRKIVIHTIAIGEFQKDFMRKIAEQNGGIFVDLGK